MNSQARLRKIEEKLNQKIGNKRVIWPILGGASKGDSYRVVTSEEGRVLMNMGQPVPIGIALSREKEFLEYLTDEHNSKVKKY